jgi:hypothetical protein
MFVRGATTMGLPPDTTVLALYLVNRLHFILELQLVTKFVSYLANIMTNPSPEWQ